MLVMIVPAKSNVLLPCLPPDLAISEHFLFLEFSTCHSHADARRDFRVSALP